MKTAKIYGKFSFVNLPLLEIAKNNFFPKSLQEVVVTSSKLSYLGNNKSDIAGGGLGFNYNEAYNSALGEFCERYSCSFQNSEGLIFDSYDNLKNTYSCYDITQLKYFSKEQYKSSDFRLNQIDLKKRFYWKWCKDFLTGKSILLPYFMIGLENIKTDGLYHYNTSTGSSAHISIEKAILGGFLECIERDGFCKFWYLQKNKKLNKISSDYILNRFPKNEKIQDIFNNQKVKIVTFNLSDFSYAPTFVTFIFFMNKGQLFQSVGSASRLNVEDALIKSCLEAYQGIEYAKICYEKYLNEFENCSDYNKINEFDKHFSFYNINPHLRSKVPILKEALNWSSNYTNKIEDVYLQNIKEFSKEELLRVGLKEIHIAEMTTQDVKQQNIDVIKVITPNLHLLTGHHQYPYLGLFDNQNDLFTEYPHPFP